MTKRTKRAIRECVETIDSIFKGDYYVSQKESVEALEEIKQEIEDRLATIGESDLGK